MSHPRLLCRIIKHIKRFVHREDEAESLVLDILIEGKTLQGVNAMQMFDDQQCTVFLKPKTAKGKDAPIEPGSAIWTGPPFISIVPAADGKSAVFVAMGLGSGRASVSIDADLGAGVRTLSREFPVTVNAREADSLDVFEDTPVDQVAAGPEANPPKPEPEPIVSATPPALPPPPPEFGQPFDPNANNAPE